MFHSREDFIRAMAKIAYQTGDDDGKVVKGKQSDDVPELLQPDKGPGQGTRGEEASSSKGVEKASKEGKQDYLSDAFSEFGTAKKQTQSDLRALLSSYSKPSADGSKAVAEKTSEVKLSAFADEMRQILEQ